MEGKKASNQEINSDNISAFNGRNICAHIVLFLMGKCIREPNNTNFNKLRNIRGAAACAKIPTVIAKIFKIGINLHFGEKHRQAFTRLRKGSDRICLALAPNTAFEV